MLDGQSKVLSSLSFQSSKVESGRCLLMMKGIFFSASSFSAMVMGSQFMLATFSLLRQRGAFLLICTALIPMILAFSNLVMKGEVILSLLGCSGTFACSSTSQPACSSSSSLCSSSSSSPSFSSSPPEQLGLSLQSGSDGLSSEKPSSISSSKPPISSSPPQSSIVDQLTTKNSQCLYTPKTGVQTVLTQIMHALQYRVLLLRVTPIGRSTMTTYYVSFNSNQQNHQSPHIHGKLTKAHPEYPWEFRTRSSEVEVRYHEINHHSNTFTLVGSSVLHLEGEGAEEEEFEIYGCNPDNQARRVAQIEFSFKTQKVPLQLMITNTEIQSQSLPEQIQPHQEQEQENLNTIIEELDGYSAETPKAQAKELNVSKNSKEQEEPLPPSYPLSHFPVRPRPKPKQPEPRKVQSESQGEQLLQQMQDNAEKWYRCLFGKRKPQPSRAPPSSLSTHSNAPLLYYEQAFQWLDQDHQERPHLLFKHMIVSPPNNPIRSIEYLQVEWNQEQQPQQTKMISAHAFHPLQQWQSSIRLPVQLKAVSIQACTDDKQKIKGLVMVGESTKAAIQMYDLEGKAVATATYSIKQVTQAVIQTSSYESFEQKAVSNVISNTLDRGFRKSAISEQKQMKISSYFQEQTPVNRKLKKEEYLFSERKRRSLNPIKKQEQIIDSKYIATKQERQPRMNLNNQAYLVPKAASTRPNPYTLPPLHASLATPNSQTHPKHPIYATISHSQGGPIKMEEPPSGMHSQIEEEVKVRPVVYQPSDGMKKVEYFLQNDDLMMINPPPVRNNSRSSIKSSSVKSEKEQQTKMKSVPVMKSVEVNTQRVKTVPQVMNINYQPPPMPKVNQQISIPVVNEQEQQYDEPDDTSQYSASTIGTTGRTLHIESISVHQYENIPGHKLVRSSIAHKGVHQTTPAPKSVNLKWVCQGHSFPHLSHKDTLLLQLCQCQTNSTSQQLNLRHTVIATAGVECRQLNKGQSIAKGFLMREGKIVGEIIVQYHISYSKPERVKSYSQRKGRGGWEHSGDKTKPNSKSKLAPHVNNSMSQREEYRGRIKETIARQQARSLQRGRTGTSGDGLRQILQRRRLLVHDSSKGKLEGRVNRARERGVRKSFVGGGLRRQSGQRLFGEWR